MSFKQAYRPFFLEYALLAELNLVRRQKPAGVFVIPSAASTLIWFGVVFIRQGYFQGGGFRFTIYIPDTFPDCDCPTVIFESPPFHPMISSTGEFDFSKSFPKWRKGTNHIWQLLLCIRRSFHHFDITNAFNLEAASLYERDPNLFKHKAEESTKMANNRLLEASPSQDIYALVFKKLTDNEYARVYSEMEVHEKGQQNTSCQEGQHGLSWVMRGSSEVFSKNIFFEKNLELDE